MGILDFNSHKVLVKHPSLHICLWLHSQIHVRHPNNSSVRLNAFSYLSRNIYCQNLLKEWPLSCPQEGQENIGFLFPLWSSFQQFMRNSPMLHIWKENFSQKILLAYAKKGSRPYQLCPNSYSKSQMSCILLGLLVFYWIVETSEGIPMLLSLLQDHHSWSITKLTSGTTSPPIHIWSLFTLNNGFQLNLLWFL